MSITAGSAIEPKRSENMTVFFLRIRARRGQHVAAVATARKLAVLLWHLLSKRESYLWARPALHARKLRAPTQSRTQGCPRAERGSHCPWLWIDS
jgi:transposase